MGQLGKRLGSEELWTLGKKERKKTKIFFLLREFAE